MKRGEKLDEEKLIFACELINRKREGSVTPTDIVRDALLIMDFGGISVQDMMNYLEE